VVKAAEQYLDFDMQEKVSGRGQGKDKPAALLLAASHPSPYRTTSTLVKASINCGHNLLAERLLSSIASTLEQLNS